MKKAYAASLLCLWLSALPPAFSAVRFEKVTDHYYWLESGPGGQTVSAVITEGGILVVNAPGEPALAETMAALQKLSSKPVNWTFSTDYAIGRSGGCEVLGRQGAAWLGGAEFWKLLDSARADDKGGAEKKDEARGRPESADRMIFPKMMRLFPDNLEIRVLSIQARSRTSGDQIVYLPAEKVLILGDLFSPGNYPLIDAQPGNGTALGWIEGMKQAIDAAPILKSAMPQPKPDPTKPPPEEKTPEELVVVVPGHGPRSNLLEVKNLYETVVKLKADAQRSVSSGRSREHFLSSVAAGVYRQFGNLDSFAGRLYDELSAAKTKPEK
jgi:glyoxylase-like metal-dependent hydrolase (beta-lactamase superfamily II)